VSGRKVELDEVIVPSLELKSSSSQKSVPVMPTPTREEANDDDHETSDHVTTQWYGNPVLEVILLDHDEPTNYGEAMMIPDSDKWLEAMKSEIGSMYENKVWTLVDLPDDRQAIENKWIFKRKTDTDGSVTTLQKKDTSVMIHVCHSRSRFLSWMYIHDNFMTESR
jgi:hypothetical protein